VDKWEAGRTNGGGENSVSDGVEASKDDQKATTAPTKKSKVVKTRGCEFCIKLCFFAELMFRSQQKLLQ